MAFLRRAIDNVNKEIQFEINEPCNSINLKFNPLFTQDYVDALQIRVERISKNTSNQLLYAGSFQEIKDVLKFALPTIGNVLPFAIAKSLNLSDDVKVLVTIQFPESAQVSKGLSELVPTSFQYELNNTVLYTENPLVIKKMAVDEELTFDTEFYPLLLISTEAESYETVILSSDEYNKQVPKKVFYGNEIIKSNCVNGLNFMTMVTQPNQSVTIKGTSINYLILLQP